MEPKFNTSFIPKQSLQTSARGPTVREYVSRRSTRGPAFYFTFLIFFITCLTSVGVFVYASVLDKSINKQVESLERARDEFQPALMKELSRLDVRLSTARTLLSAHVAPSNFLRMLEVDTLRDIRITSLSFRSVQAEGAPQSVVEAKLTGQAPDFESIALQRDEFAKNKYIPGVAVSNVNVDGEGNATFTLDLSVDPRLISFVDTLDLRSAPAQPSKTAPKATTTVPAATSTSAQTQP